MTAQNLIAIGGLLAAVFSALAAAFAVKQSKLQRTTLTKPQVIVTSITILVDSKSDEIFLVSPKDEESIGNFKVPIKNVGLGTALNLKYSWHFDYLDALDTCGFLRTDIHQMDILSSIVNTEKLNNSVYIEESSNNEYSYFSFFKNHTYKAFSVSRFYTEIEYIIPITQDETLTTLTLPYLIPILTINKFENLNSITDMMLTKMDAGILKLEYEDISGHRFFIKFACSIRLVRYTSNIKRGSEALYELKLHRIQKSYHVKSMLDGISSKFHFLTKRF
ncbi:hypothetical protein ABEH87_11455 [Erwinia sp. Eh17-17]|uniref:hypothetical protein n=1 Tax=Erwinia sp. Eh17-17 TaxID=3080330 RepID=UPI00320984C9